MKRIILVLVLLSSALSCTALGVGLSIKHAKTESRESEMAAVNSHMGIALFALIGAALVHSLVLTYFMGTSRWMEETTKAYSLAPERMEESSALKYRMIITMTVCLFLLIFTGALGAAAGAGAFKGFPSYNITAGTVHFTIAALTITLNLIVNIQEYQAIGRNTRMIEDVMVDVRRIRTEKGLPV